MHTGISILVTNVNFVHCLSWWLVLAEDEIIESLSTTSPCGSQSTSGLDDDQEKRLLSPLANKTDNLSFVKEAPLKWMWCVGGGKNTWIMQVVLAWVFNHLIWRDASCPKISHFSMAFCIPWFHCLKVYARNSVALIFMNQWLMCMGLSCSCGRVFISGGIVGALSHVNYIHIWKWIMKDSLHVSLYQYDCVWGLVVHVPDFFISGRIVGGS